MHLLPVDVSDVPILRVYDIEKRHFYLNFKYKVESHITWVTIGRSEWFESILTDKMIQGTQSGRGM